MNTTSNHRRFRRTQGSTLILVLIVTGTLGFVTVAYLRLIMSQNSFTVRSQIWNNCLPLVEAGIEDALAQLNKNANSNYTVNGWTGTSTLFTKVAELGDGYYSVTVNCSNLLMPTITSTGYLPAPATVASTASGVFFAAAFTPDPNIRYISRTVRVTAKKDPLLPQAMVAKSYVDFNGNNIHTDSYNSSSGAYNPAAPSDQGDVSMNGDILNPGNIGNANIRGRLTVGPTATCRIGPNGIVGSNSWYAAGQKGIQPGCLRRDANFSFPDVQAPWTSGALTPGNYGAGYKYVLDNGNYELNNLNLSSGEKMWVKGPSVLYVKANVNISGTIQVDKTGTLFIYIGGPNCTLSGTYDKSDIPAEFRVYGLPSLKNIDVNGFAATIYAPSAKLTLNGGVQFYGASITDSVVMNGNTAYHYDEALRAMQNTSYVITSWNEI